MSPVLAVAHWRHKPPRVGWCLRTRSFTSPESSPGQFGPARPVAVVDTAISLGNTSVGVTGAVWPTRMMALKYNGASARPG